MFSSKHAAHLVPPLFEQDAADDFHRSGRTISLAVSPRGDGVAIYASPNTLQLQNVSYPKAQTIYLANRLRAPLSERRVFITDTSVIFAAVQNLTKVSRAKDVEIVQNDEARRAICKLTNDYVNFCKECCLYASQNISRPEPLQFDPDHYRCLWTSFSLFAVLYTPEPGFDDAPVGDDLMEWLNTHYVQPSTQEGDGLSSQERPWEDPAFWSYLTRTSLRGLTKASVFFLNVLSKHPSTYLQSLAQQLSPLLTNHPRLSQFSAEKDFAVASRRWKDKVKTLRLELDRVPESERDDGFENWWDRFSDIVGVLEGQEDVIKRVCTELGADWKEVCCVWGIFVDTRLRRHDLPDIVAQVLDEMPLDPTDREDMVHSALFLGRPTQALAEAAQLDIWLAAHLADLMEPIELIDSEPDDSDLSSRQHYILAYAEYLRTDPALWRITVDYMYSCGPVGRGMADQVLMRVPLRLEAPKDADAAGEEAARIRAGHLAGVLKDVNETCFEHQREEIRRMVCRIAAQSFIREKAYGLAISYCTSAEDWAGLGRVVDLVLEEYIAQGPEQFARLVANIAPSLHSLRTEAGTKIPAPGVFLHRLMFAVRFAEFHQRRASGDGQGAAFDVVAMFREDITPKSWWAVLLCDSLELLQNGGSTFFTSTDACLLIQKLEEIQIAVVQGAAEDYLPILCRVTKRGEKHALQRLEVVRLSLARYYARCGAIGVGGRPSGWNY
ncbi:Nup85 nucleoporin-domain-containing protein [Cubamyces lactineus]|nr:Nup85 nucleoporin-domain-containing protein [Cubamyces lactineus]